MNILYTCDNNYIWIMGISMISLFENNREIESINVYLLGDNISGDNKQILNKLANQYSRKIEVIDVPNLKIPISLLSKRWPLSAFTRLFAGQLLPSNINKIIYIDCDTIITGNIQYLQNFELGDELFAGVKDCISRAYTKNIGIDKSFSYINAGLLIINLEALRKENISEKIDDYLKKYYFLINYADQDILNGVFYRQIKTVPPQYNVMTVVVMHTYDEINALRRPINYYTRSEFEKAVIAPVIIHYTTNMRIIRPWYANTNHPLRDEFKKYFMLSPWKNNTLNKYEFKNRESKMIEIIQYLPNKIAFRFLGILHAEIKPKYIKFKSVINYFGEKFK